MRYKIIKESKDEEFLHLTGLNRATFEKGVTILQEAEKKQKASGGKPNKLTMEDRLLMTLEYLRKYRTYFYIASNYGMAASTCYRNIKWVEETLAKHPDFVLPGKKELLEDKGEDKTGSIDGTESP